MESQRTTCLKKESAEQGRIIAYEDEAAICLCPPTKRTYALRGQTPVLKVGDSKKYQHLSMSALMSEKGDLFYEVREGSFNGKALVRQLEKNFGGRKKQKYRLIWDGASIHKGQAIKDYLKANEKKQRVLLTQLPPYCPELNPVELLWAYLKGTALAGIVAKNLQELKQIVIQKMEDIKKNTQLILSFFQMEKIGFMQS